MKFFSDEPKLVVIDSRTHRKLLQFDENCEFETTDENLIKRLSTRFKYEEEKPKKPKKTNTNKRV